MEVTGPGSVQSAFPVKPSVRPMEPTGPTAEPKTLAPRDEVAISAAGMMLEKLHESPELRAARLAEIKAAIEAGTYETPEKLEAALSRMLDELNHG